MKKVIIAMVLVVVLIGCSKKQDEVNIMEIELSQSPFYAEGTMVQEENTYEVKMRREGDIKTITLMSDKLKAPITYILEKGGLSIDNEGKDLIKLEREKIPENCIALLVWDGLEHLSKGTSQKTNEGITVTKQDRGVATATKEKKMLTINFPSKEWKITFNHFEYLQK